MHAKVFEIMTQMRIIMMIIILLALIVSSLALQHLLTLEFTVAGFRLPIPHKH